MEEVTGRYPSPVTAAVTPADACAGGSPGFSSPFTSAPATGGFQDGTK